MIEQLGKGNCDFLASVVVRPHGAYPEKVLKFFSFFFHFFYSRNLSIRRLVTPIFTFLAVESPRIPLPLNTCHCALGVTVHFSFCQYEVAAEVDDFIHVLIHDRALILTVPASGACPNFFLCDDVADQAWIVIKRRCGFLRSAAR